MSHTDTRSVGDLKAQVDALDAASPSDLTADERARLIDALVALADAYGARGDFHAEANALSNLERLHAAHPDAEIDVHLATAHANAKAGRLAQVEPLCERLETVYETHPEPDVAASLLTGYAHAEQHLETDDAGQTAGDGTPVDRLERAETLFESHPDADVGGLR